MDEAERLFEECLRRSLAVKKSTDEETITTMAALGNVQRQQGKRERPGRSWKRPTPGFKRSLVMITRAPPSP